MSRRSREHTGHVDIERHEKTVELSRKINFVTMARMLLEDVKGEIPTKLRALPKLDDKSTTTAPLAKCVAEERLKSLNLSAAITLQLAGKKEIRDKLNPRLKPPLSDVEIEERRAVIGYQWAGGYRFAPGVKERLELDLKTYLEEANSSLHQLIMGYVNIARFWASRFFNKGELEQDLIGVANVELVSAALRFDWRVGYTFGSFLDRTIPGAIQRHFRDNVLLVRRQRNNYENYPKVFLAQLELQQSLGRQPTVVEIAKQAKLPEALVEEILNPRRRVYSTGPSQDDPLDLGEEDEGFERVLLYGQLRPLLDVLDERERKVVLFSFFQNMTQKDIAKIVGVSQMEVSRIITKALKKMRGVAEQAAD